MKRRDLGLVATVTMGIVLLAAIAVLFLGTQISLILTTTGGLQPNMFTTYGIHDLEEGQTDPPGPVDLQSGVAALRVGSLDIPLDHAGLYELPLGEAVLPSGYLSEKHMNVANGQDGTYDTAGGIWLDLRDGPEGTPLPDSNAFRGLTDGPRHVVVTLRFNLRTFDPGAVMRLRDIVVR